MPKPEYHDAGGRNKGTTVALMLRMTKPIHGTGKVVVLDSGFCVLQGIISLREAGVFSAALIKKRRYWPKFIEGDAVKERMEEKSVGDCDAWRGELDGWPFYIHCMKEPDYVMMLMSTYGLMERMGEEKRRDVAGTRVVFRYPEIIHNHYQYRDAVDSNNARRMQPIALEETWQTTRWANRPFSYLLATSAVNANLAYCYFNGKETMDELSARKLLAKQLIFNRYLDESDGVNGRRRSRRSTIDVEHALLQIPDFHKFDNTGQLVRAKSRYPQAQCFCRKKRPRTYCRCTPGIRRCTECYAVHVTEVAVNSLQAAESPPA